jgi:hypothetical protein
MTRGEPSVRTTKADEIRQRIIDLARDEESGWEPVPSVAGLTIRRTTEHETPEYARAKPGEGAGFGTWDQPTYHSHVFVTLVGRKVIVGYAACPWVGRTDSETPYWLTEAILADHTLAGDYQRINAMRAERKKARP